MCSDGNECNNTHHVDYKCPDPNKFVPGTKEHRDAVSSRVAFRNLLIDQLLWRKMDDVVSFSEIEVMSEALKKSLRVGAHIADLRRVLERERDVMLRRLLKTEDSMMCSLHAEM